MLAALLFSAVLAAALSASAPTHLVVLVHGLHGSPSSMAVVEAHLNATYGDKLLVLNSAANFGALNSFWTTSDGLVAGGRRLAADIERVLAANPQVSRLSMIPLSLGGLYARYALYELSSRGKLEGIILENFVSIASPHLGVAGHLNALIHKIVSWGFCGDTGRQLLLEDHPTAPLLLNMTEKPFLEPLARFTRRVLYANLENDDKVPHWSAAIAPKPGFLHTKTHHDEFGVEIESDVLTDHENATYRYIHAKFRQVPVKVATPLGSVDGTLEQVVLESDASGEIVTESVITTEESIQDTRSDKEKRFDTMVDIMAYRLRQDGGVWHNVDVKFENDWLAPFANHFRIAANRGTTMGIPVVKHVVEQSFVP